MTLQVPRRHIVDFAAEMPPQIRHAWRMKFAQVFRIAGRSRTLPVPVSKSQAQAGGPAVRYTMSKIGRAPCGGRGGSSIMRFSQRSVKNALARIGAKTNSAVFRIAPPGVALFRATIYFENGPDR
jgi:hypothetical protein